MDKKEPNADEFSRGNEIFEISGFQNTKTKQKKTLKHYKIIICKYLNVSKYSIIWTIQLQLNRNQIFTQIIISMGCGYILTCLLCCGVGLLKARKFRAWESLWEEKNQKWSQKAIHEDKCKEYLFATYI